MSNPAPIIYSYAMREAVARVKRILRRASVAGGITTRVIDEVVSEIARPISKLQDEIDHLRKARDEVAKKTATATSPFALETKSERGRSNPWDPPSATDLPKLVEYICRGLETGGYCAFRQNADYGHITLEGRKRVLDWLSVALASLRAPAGDVPGEAQTQEGGR